MNAPEDLNRLYADVSNSIGSAMADILSLDVEHKDGKRELGTITEKLRGIQARFDNELLQLKTHAEWDTFTLAFFGETNAGKSTIIESLRILFNEDSRQALLQQYADDLQAFELALMGHLDHVREGLHVLYSEYIDELTVISQSTAQLAKILHNEATERTQIAQAEADARTELAQQETRARLDVEQQEAAQRQQLAESESAARTTLAEQEANARLAMEQQEATQRQQLAESESAARTALAEQEVNARLAAEQQEATQRQQLAESETAARTALAEQEVNARLAAEQQETARRLRIEEAHAASTLKKRLVLFSVGGILIGAVTTAALLKLSGV